MTDEKKPSIWTQLFGAKHSSCCDLKIEEVTEEEPQQGESTETKTEAKRPAQQNSCCCNQPPPEKK